MDKQFKVKMMCYDPGYVTPYEDEPATNVYGDFNTVYRFAQQLAQEEVEYLNDGCDSHVSFGIVYGKDRVLVKYYYNPEDDTTGNTETVTIYYLEQMGAEVRNRELWKEKTQKPSKRVVQLSIDVLIDSDLDTGDLCDEFINTFNDGDVIVLGADFAEDLTETYKRNNPNIFK